MRSTVIMLLISCLTVMGCDKGCYNPNWSNKDADFLITQLKNNRYYQLREKAVYLLASKAQERDKVIPALTHALLNDEYAYVRDAAADVLGSIEPPAVSAIPALIETLRNENTGKMAGFDSNGPQVRERALTSLGEMGPDAAEAIPALTEFFRNGWDDAGLVILKIDPSMRAVKEELIERRAVRQLAELAEAGDASLIPVLIKFLNDSKHSCAARALKDIGTPEALEAAVPAFIQLLDAPKKDKVRRRYARYAAEELKDIGTPEALEAVKQFEKPRWWPF